MPRSRKPRHCSCPFPDTVERVFKPAGIPGRQLRHERIAHDELESLYLCDGLGLTQEEAGERMGVSRGTVQRLLVSARRKVALGLVEGVALCVEGAALSPDAQTES